MLNCRNSIEFAGFENANQSTAILEALRKAIVDTLGGFSRCVFALVLGISEIVFVGKRLPHLAAGTTLPVPMRFEKSASRHLPIKERGLKT